MYIHYPLLLHSMHRDNFWLYAFFKKIRGEEWALSVEENVNGLLQCTLRDDRMYLIFLRYDSCKRSRYFLSSENSS